MEVAFPGFLNIYLPSVLVTFKYFLWIENQISRTVLFNSIIFRFPYLGLCVASVANFIVTGSCLNQTETVSCYLYGLLVHRSTFSHHI